SVLTAFGVDRVCRFAFDYALAHPPLGGRPLVTSVDKANVLRSYAFWRRHFDAVAQEYGDRVDASRIYVDAFCAHLVLAPQKVHVAVAENMFGDIVSDLGGAVAGSLGLAPSGDIGDVHGVFQSAHGSAPDIAGQGVANPVATILSAVMLLEWLGLGEMAADIERAVAESLTDGASRTADVGGTAGTQAAAQAVIAALRGPA
ncbi:MAG: isocitrate/isopropylmalate family dehydrogenase, partial [Candidatus Dormibacteraeota bacterium]|nr:isocitrate/isopropylmalate family dehydrogenase [Candidatus Dormibacteraeota bacterium]